MKALDIMGVNKGGNGGIIVNISSLLALKVSSHLPVYAATKTAVLQFSIAMGVSRFITLLLLDLRKDFIGENSINVD